MNMRRLLLIAPIVCTTVVVAGTASAQSLSGSTGGTIGKQGRSAAGNNSDGPNRSDAARQQPRSKAESSSSATLTAASLRGRWSGSLNCPDGQMALSLDIRETSQTTFGGDYGDEGGKIVSGQFSGGRISFVTQAIISRTWTGSVSRSGAGLRMQGSHKAEWGANSLGAGNCRFSATKG
jgi:hypothetical protein